MKVPPVLKTALPLFFGLAGFALDAHAAIDGAGLFDSVLARYSGAASSWAGAITSAASWLFWTLVVISMVWTFGMMALRKADIGEFFAEFLRFTMFTGFFWWLLTNGPNFASSIYASLRTIAANATGLSDAISPSGIVDVGFEILYEVIDQSSLWSPVDTTLGFIVAIAILVILALVGVNMLLLLASAWILAYGGVFFLGFGGSRWTSDMAINYFKTVLSVAAQLMTMVLLVGIGKTFLDDYYSRMSAGISLKEMGVILIVVIILLALVNKLPALIGQLPFGGGTGSQIGNFGAGAALGAAGAAAAAVATGGAMLAAGASAAAGGAQALMAAFSKASENVQSGSDVFTSMWGGGGGGGGGGKRDEGTGSTPFAQAAGFASSGGAQASGGGSGAKAEGQSGDAKGKDEGKSDQGQGKAGESKDGGGTGGSGKAEGGQQQSSGGLMSAAGKAGLIAADAAANLAKGTAQVAKEKMASIKDAAMDRIAETTGGKIAAAIKAGNVKDGAESAVESAPTFGGNNLAAAGTSDADAAAEVAAFANRDTKSA